MVDNCVKTHSAVLEIGVLTLPRPYAKCNKVLKNATCLRGHLLSHDVARTTLWAWLYFISSCTSEESVDITLAYEDDKTNWPTKSSFAFFVIYDQLE